MKKRFIILVDFSEFSGSLIKYASDWARQISAELLLIHQSTVLAPPMTEDEIRQQITRINHQEALQELESYAEKLIPPSIKVSFSVSEKNLVETIPQFLAEPFDQLIFAGIKGTGLLKRIFLGSTVLQIINNSENIVVATPGALDIFSPQRIFVGVTEKYPLNTSELRKFLDFVDAKNTLITFFHLSQNIDNAMPMEETLRELTTKFADGYKTDFAIYKGDNSFSDIKNVINDKINEILVVQRGSQLLTDQWFRRFIINELVYEGQTPLVVLPS